MCERSRSHSILLERNERSDETLARPDEEEANAYEQAFSSDYGVRALTLRALVVG